jgi:hypothetical protein
VSRNKRSRRVDVVRPPLVAANRDLYGYAPVDGSNKTQYDLTRDGKPVLTGTEQECWKCIHETTSVSVYQALKFEGWKMATTKR